MNLFVLLKERYNIAFCFLAILLPLFYTPLTSVFPGLISKGNLSVDKVFPGTVKAYSHSFSLPFFRSLSATAGQTEQ